MATNTANAQFSGTNYGSQFGQYIVYGTTNERQTVVQWLSPLNFAPKQADVLRDRLSGTGGQFKQSQQFQDWLNGKTKVLWCHGIPGSGKTVLISAIVDHLRNGRGEVSKETIASVYCEYKQQEAQTPQNLLAGIWRELVQSLRTLPEEARGLYKKHELAGTKPSEKEVLGLLKHEMVKSKVVWILVDAIDECPVKVQRTFVESLQNLLSEPTLEKTLIRLLITSRLSESPFPEAEKIEIWATEEDITLYVRQRIVAGVSPSSHTISAFIQEDKALQEELVTGIAEKARGMFLMARLYMDFLENLTSLKDVREALQSLPEEVTEFYQEAWSRIEQQRGGLRQLAQQAIYWLSSALTQLTIDQLRVALAVRKADRYLEIERLPAIDVLIQVCQGLVQVDSESKIIRLVHFTTQEFFDAIRSQSFPDIHKNIASTCLTYLTFDEFKNGPCKFISTRALDMGKTEGEIKSSNVLARRIARNPLLIYVVHHWGHHACMAPEEVLEPEILSFLAMPQNVASAIQAQYVGSQWPYDSELNAPGSLALHVAVCFGLRHTAKILLEPMSSNEVNLLDCRRKTALHWAVESGSTKMALLLLQAGADLNTPIRGESNEYMKIIMGIGADNREIRWRVGSGVKQDVIAKRNLVYIAVESDQEEQLAAWTERGADSSIVKERANDVLGKASLLDKPKVIELALRLGADIEARDQRGRTALLVAVEEVHNAAFKVLLSKGASTDVVCSSGRRSDILQIAVESQRIFEERLSMILNCQASYPVTSGIRPRSSRANEKVWDELLKVLRARPLSLMSQELFEALHEDRANEDIIRTLLDYGADSAMKTQDGQTLLHLAICSTWRLETLLQWARQNMATALNVNVKDAMGRTALHYAAAAANPSAMVTLLAHGADINAKDANMVTVLHFSVETHDCIVQALGYGAEVDATDSSGRSALHYLIMLTEEPKLDELSNWQRTYNVPGPKKDARDANGNKTKAHYMAIPRECDERCLNLFAAAYARLGPHDDPADNYGMRVQDYAFATKAAHRNFEGTISWLSEMKQRYRLQRAILYKTIEHVIHEARLNSETWTLDMDEYYGVDKRWRTNGDDEIQETLSAQGPLSNRVMTFRGKKPEVLDSNVFMLVTQD